MPNVTISLNKDILKLIDESIKQGKYVSRYDFVKSAVEEKSKQEEKKEVERGKESEREDSGTDGQVRNNFEDID